MALDGVIQDRLAKQAEAAALIEVSEGLWDNFPNLNTAKSDEKKKADGWVGDATKRLAKRQKATDLPSLEEPERQKSLRAYLLLDALSRNGRQRKHRLTVKPNAALAAALAPVGRTIFDDWSENSVEISNSNENKEGQTTAPLDLNDDKPRADRKPLAPVFSLEASPTVIAYRLRSAREAKGWTQIELAQAMGLKTKRAVQNLENARDGVTVSAIRSAMEALEIQEL